jgi:hypothetical protein
MWLPRRARDLFGIAQGQIMTAAMFNEGVQRIGCTHLPVYRPVDVVSDAIDHILDEHLYPGGSAGPHENR